MICYLLGSMQPGSVCDRPTPVTFSPVLKKTIAVGNLLTPMLTFEQPPSLFPTIGSSI